MVSWLWPGGQHGHESELTFQIATKINRSHLTTFLETIALSRKIAPSCKNNKWSQQQEGNGTICAWVGGQMHRFVIFYNGLNTFSSKTISLWFCCKKCVQKQQPCAWSRKTAYAQCESGNNPRKYHHQPPLSTISKDLSHTGYVKGSALA